MAKYALRALGAPVLYSDDGAYFVVIGGTPVFVEAGSLSIDNTIGRRSTASFTVHTTTATHFQQWQQVLIYDQHTTIVFSGYISNPKEQKPGYQNSLIHTISCVDQHYLADKRIITASYLNKTCGFIVQDILTRILSQEGVTIGQIYDGLTPSTKLYPSTTLYPGGNVGLIPSANFSYATVAAAMDALVTAASSSGVPYYWMIDALKRLWFVPYTAVVNSTVVDGTLIDQVNNPPSVSRQNALYRNTQYLTGGVAQTVLQNETRKGDGVTTSWPMQFDLASAPTITLNTVAQNVGIRGVNTGYQYYWQQGSPDITQDSSAVKLISTDTLAISYIGQYPATIIDQNNAQQQLQASIDGSSGIVEVVQNDPTITSIANGLSEASQLLTRYAVQGTILVFTQSPKVANTYAPGQLITVNLPMFALYSVQMLIENVSISDQQDGYNLWPTITAVVGPYDTSWVDFFSTLLTQKQPANSINVGVGQSVAILQSFTATLSLTTTLNVNVYACPIPATTQFPSLTLFPC